VDKISAQGGEEGYKVKPERVGKKNPPKRKSKQKDGGAAGGAPFKGG